VLFTRTQAEEAFGQAADVLARPFRAAANGDNQDLNVASVNSIDDPIALTGLDRKTVATYISAGIACGQAPGARRRIYSLRPWVHWDRIRRIIGDVIGDVASYDDFHYVTPRSLAVMKKSTKSPSDGILSKSGTAQGAPGRLAGTLSRKDERMQVTPPLTIDIVSDIV
jgi:hypothetical protein